MPNYLRSPAQNRLGIFLVLAFLSGILITFLYQRFRPAAVLTVQSCLTYNMTRMEGYEHIQPILSVDRESEAKRYFPLKNELQALVDSLKDIGAVTDASVFFQEFSQGRWMSLNGEKRYHPASLMKVGLLLCYLRMAEAMPGLLKEKWLYDKPASVEITPQFYDSHSIKTGREYSVHDLLYYMVAHSDNHATWLLSSKFDVSHLKKLFVEFGLPEPVEDELQFMVSPSEYALFFKAIYNGAYLSPEFSEYAANLLSHSTFKEGFAKGFPENTKMWRKFGEWRSPGEDFELHESGIVYIYDKPYHLTVMTKGLDTEKLAEAIRAICKIVYKGAMAADKLPNVEAPAL